jgi:trk system potassium uptake protein TrkA
MNVVILGAGRVGWQLARQLVSEGKEVTIIEKNPEEARRAADRLDCRVVVGEGNSVPILRKAGIEQADFFVSATESDEINMIACSLVAAEYTEPVTVARVRNVAYSTSRMVRQRLYGIDHIINPEIEAARAVIRSLERGAVGTVNPFTDSGLTMTSITVDPGCSLPGRQVKEIRMALSGEFLLPLLIRDGNSMIPSGDTTVLANDLLYVIAGPEGTDAIISAAGLRRRELRRIAIAGGGRIGRYVADYLLGKGDDNGSVSSSGIWTKLIGRFRRKPTNRSVHFIERDYAVGRELAESYPNALVTNADISDEEVSETGLLEGYDLLVSATGNQELNLVSALHAKNHGVARTIALVRKASYVNMAREMGVDVTVSVTDTMVDSILRILRKGNIRSVHTIAGSDFEIIDFLLDKESPLVGKLVRDLKLPKDSLILMVNRGEEYLIPDGKLLITEGDRLMVITPREAVKKLEEAVAGS